MKFIWSKKNKLLRTKMPFSKKKYNILKEH